MANKFIGVEYKLYTENAGEKVLREETREDRPFVFVSGMGYTLESFEKHIVDLNEGDEFDFTLSPEEAYGKVEVDRILELDRSIFQMNGHFDHEHIFDGADVPMQNDEGAILHGKVLKITDETVIMDFNHPLAGEAIQYVGKIVESHEATEDEVNRFIAFLTEDHSGCSCDHDHCSHDHCGCDHHHHDGCGCGHCH